MRKDTVCIVAADDSCEETKIRMNKVVRKNLRVWLGDIICVHPCLDIEYGKRIHILPHWRQGLTGNLFDAFIKREFSLIVVLRFFLSPNFSVETWNSKAVLIPDF